MGLNLRASLRPFSTTQPATPPRLVVDLDGFHPASLLGDDLVDRTVMEA